MSRPNPKDFRSENLKDQIIVKEPGSIHGLDYSIDTLQNCEVWILDHSSQILIDDSTNCKFYFGPCEGPVMMRNCTNCILSCAAQQIRISESKNIVACIFAATEPTLELCENIFVGPYNLSYPGQANHFQLAKLNPSQNLWSQVFDFSKSTGQHWNILPVQNFQLNVEKIVGEGTPENPVPIPVQYGGTLQDEIIIGSQQQGMQESGDMMQFNIQGEPFGNYESQMYAQEQMLSENNETSQQYSKQNNQDSFAGLQKPNQNYQQFQQEEQDPFAGLEQSNQNYQQFQQEEQDPFAEVQKNNDYKIINEMEDQIRQRLWQKSEEERSLKEERRQVASTFIKNFQQSRYKTVQARHQQNLDEENQEKAVKERAKRDLNVWELAARCCELQEQSYPGAKDVSILRRLILIKKNEKR